MRILYHHRILSADGQLVHIREMVDALRRRGHEVRVVGPEVEATATDGSSTFVTALKNRLPQFIYELAEVAYNAIVFARLVRAISKLRPDVVYERNNLFLFAGVWACRLWQIPFLLEVNAPLAEERGRHGGLAFQRFAKWSEARVWHAGDAVFTVTKVLADGIVATGVDRERIIVTPNGVNASRFARLSNREQAKTALGLTGRTIVGFAGFVREWHGLDAVVDWLARTAADDVVLLIVGDGPASEPLRHRAEALGVADRLIVTGVVRPAEIPNYLASFDVALQPAVVPYASPLKILEYMAAGCAIVAPDTPNIRELLDNDITGLLVAPNGLSSALDRLVSMEDLRCSLGTAARREVEVRGLSWERNAESVERRANELMRSK